MTSCQKQELIRRLPCCIDVKFVVAGAVVKLYSRSLLYCSAGPRHT